jgi:hypothetical protein
VLTQFLTDRLYSVLAFEEITQVTEQAPQALPTTGEEAPEILTKSSQTSANISEKEALHGLKEYPLPIHYPHSSVPDHAPRLVDEGKFQEGKRRRRSRVVYQQRHSRDKTGQEVPEQLMTVQDVIDTLQLPPRTVWSWFSTGRLKERGRVWLAEPGGRGSPLVSLAQGESLKNERPPRGRPPKKKSDRTPEIKAPKEGSAHTYEVVSTLRQAAEKTGVPVEEIMTVRDIQAEFGINRTHILDWSRRGRHGQPHLPSLPVRLKGAGGGQLLFLREEVERKVPNPPKTGRPPT